MMIIVEMVLTKQKQQQNDYNCYQNDNDNNDQFIYKMILKTAEQSLMMKVETTTEFKETNY